ncbi:hypothetical protein QLX08_011497 [Tetragonisca angustula]|uniref:Uncharacterized protein n=1 Tax=Tetragonisca angustula TaxID=166442 RepID=A0AAW0Z9K2_9HYME
MEFSSKKSCSSSFLIRRGGRFRSQEEKLIFVTVRPRFTGDYFVADNSSFVTSSVAARHLIIYNPVEASFKD